jgi:hypothetical protein
VIVEYAAVSEDRLSFLSSMAFTENEISEHTLLIEDLFWSRRRPPVSMREKIREGQRFTDQSIEFFYVRPAFNRPGKLIEESIAKVRLNRSRGVWHLYWQRADLKWHVYEPFPEADSLADALRVIDEDAWNCFFG